MNFPIAVLSFLTFSSARNLQARQAGVPRPPSRLGIDGFGSSGGFSNFRSDTPVGFEVERLFESAGRQPNLSSSVTFDLGPGSVRYDQSGWTWRVNLTELAVPQDIFPGDYRVVNEQWELQWPGGGSLESLLAQHAGYTTNSTRPCVTALSYRLPANVTSRYSVSDNGNCTAVLGTECAQRLLQSAHGQCSSSVLSPANAAECADTLGLDTSPSAFTQDIGTGGAFESGDTFFFSTSPALPSTNVTERYEERETNFKILLLNNLPGTSDIGSTVLCQVVNPSASSAAGIHQGLAQGNIMWMVCVAMVWVLFLS